MITQPWAIAITVALFVLTAVAFWFFTFHADFNSGWVAIGVPFAVLLVAFGSLFWSLNDNFYHVKSGVVVAQSYTPAHESPPVMVSTGKSVVYVPGSWIPDDWAVEIKDTTGHTGWFHYSSNVFSQYPDGSRYP